jgi:hypothetical protein
VLEAVQQSVQVGAGALQQQLCAVLYCYAQYMQRNLQLSRHLS